MDVFGQDVAQNAGVQDRRRLRHCSRGYSGQLMRILLGLVARSCKTLRQRGCWRDTIMGSMYPSGRKVEWWRAIGPDHKGTHLQIRFRRFTTVRRICSIAIPCGSSRGKFSIQPGILYTETRSVSSSCRGLTSFDDEWLHTHVVSIRRAYESCSRSSNHSPSTP